MTSNRIELSGYEVYPILIKVQQGRCGACPSEGPFVVDHDHETGRVRGLLCRACNSLEGQIRSGLFTTEATAGLLAFLAAPPATPFGWFWDYPDSRMSPSRIAADAERAIAMLQSVELPLGASPDPAAVKPWTVSIDDAIGALAAIELPPLGGSL